MHCGRRSEVAAVQTCRIASSAALVCGRKSGELWQKDIPVVEAGGERCYSSK